MDVDEIFSKFGDKYDVHIKQMLDYTYELLNMSKGVPKDGEAAKSTGPQLADEGSKPSNGFILPSSSNPTEADYEAHSSQQVYDGHVNPWYDSGKRITQSEYDRLAMDVQSNGSAAKTALEQLSGAHIIK